VINSELAAAHRHPMLEGIQMGAAQPAVVMTPFTLAGAMAPVSIAGRRQQNAEALAGLVLTQLVRPGAPFVYGGFTSNVDMNRGTAFARPNTLKSALLADSSRAAIVSPIAPRTPTPPTRSTPRLPTKASLAVGRDHGRHQSPDAWCRLDGRRPARLVEKMVLERRSPRMVAEFLRPVVVNEAELALDAIREVGPGGHFFGCAHTMGAKCGAFYAPMISDWRNYESWTEAGQPTPTTPPIVSTRARCVLSGAGDGPARWRSSRFGAAQAEGGVPTDF